MRNRLAPAICLTVLCLLGGCGSASSLDTGEGSPPGIVEAVATESVPVYLRPDSASTVWANLLPGESVQILAVTARGWLGFDPGVAQAGNSGSFRYRWLAPGSALSMQGEPDLLGVVWGPAADVGYAMTFDPVPVYQDPDSASAIVDSLPGNSAAAIIDLVPSWYRIDPVDGPHPGTAPGWVSMDAVSVNGPLPGPMPWNPALQPSD